MIRPPKSIVVLREPTNKLAQPPVLACRLCLSTDCTLFNIWEHRLAHIIQLLCGVIVPTPNNLPLHVCSFCKHYLKKFYSFRERCLTANNLLMNASLSKQEITTDDIRTLDRSLLKLPLVIACDEVDCLNKDYDDRNDTQTHSVFKEETHEMNISKSTTDIYYHVTKSNANHPNNMTHTSGLSSNSLLNVNNVGLTEMLLGNDSSNNERVGETKNQKHTEENESKGFYYYISPSMLDGIENENTSSESDSEEEELPQHVSISKETNVDLNIVLLKPYKVFLENIFMTLMKHKNTLIEEKLCQLERIKKVLLYNKSPIVEKLEAKDMSFLSKRTASILRTNMWLNNQEKRLEYEEKYKTKIIMLNMEQQEKEFQARKLSNTYLKRPHKCDVCFQGFKTQHAYKFHLMLHDPRGGRHKCEMCQQYYSKAGRLKRHIEQHAAAFECNICKHRSNNSKSAERHHSVMHSKRAISCPHCSLDFRWPSGFYSHMRINHPTKHISCELCGESFLTAGGLNFHRTKTHQMFARSDSFVKFVTCGTCKVRFATVDALRRHRPESAEGGCPPSHLTCVECGESFASESALGLHAAGHKTRLPCNWCGMNFADNGSLRVHIKRRHPNVRLPRLAVPRPKKNNPKKIISTKSDAPTTFICEYCGKSMRNKYYLESHILCHKGTQPYPCSQCSKRFISNYALQCHMARHTGKALYRCNDCGKNLYCSSNLKRHQDMHAGIKRFACEECGKRLSTPAALRRHMRTLHVGQPQQSHNKRRKKKATSTNSSRK